MCRGLLRLYPAQAIGLPLPRRNRRLQGGRGRRLRFVVGAGNQAAIEQRFIARALRIGVGQLRGIARDDGLRLLQGGLEWPRIDREKQLAFADVCAFSEMDRTQLTRGLRANLNRDDRFDRTNGSDRHRHVLVTVHGKIDLIREQCLLEFFDEEPLAAEIRQRAPVPVGVMVAVPSTSGPPVVAAVTVSTVPVSEVVPARSQV